MSEVAMREQAKAPGRFNDPRVQLRLAILIWLIPFLVITILVAWNPAHRNVTPLYHKAVADWWAGKDLYHGPGGMNYLPEFLLLFAPFHWLPAPAGDILWRLCTALLLVTGIWRLQRDHFGTEIARAFLFASIFTMPLCLGALRNGQANALFAAITLQAVACLPYRQWWTAAFFIVLALAIKPLAIVLLLLSVTVYAPLRWRLLPFLAALVLLPFLFAPADYVIAQHRSFIANIQSCATITEHRFADIGGIARTFGWEIPIVVSKLLRLAAGLAILGLWVMGSRRLTEPLRAMWLLALSTCYLMLFNPMNESNSYVIFAPAMGLWAVAAIEAAPTRRFGWLTASISWSMALLPNMLRPLFGNYFALFWHPVMTAVFISMLVYWLWRPDSPFGISDLKILD